MSEYQWADEPEGYMWADEEPKSRRQLNRSQAARSSFSGQSQAELESGQVEWDRANLAEEYANFYGGWLWSKEYAEKIKKESSETKARLAPQMQAWAEQRRRDEEEYANSPSWYDEPTFGGKVKGFGEALLGQVEGGILSPESWIGAGRGASLLSSILKNAGVNAGVNAAVDVSYQGQNMALGAQDEYDPMSTLVATGVGTAIGGTGGAVAHGLDARAKAKDANAAAKIKEAIEAERAANTSTTTLKGIPTDGNQGELDFPGAQTTVEEIAARRVSPEQPDLFAGQGPQQVPGMQGPPDTTTLRGVPQQDGQGQLDLPEEATTVEQIAAQRTAQSNQGDLFAGGPPPQELPTGPERQIIEQQAAAVEAEQITKMDRKLQGLLTRIPEEPTAPDATRFDPNSTFGWGDSLGSTVDKIGRDGEVKSLVRDNKVMSVLTHLADHPKFTKVQKDVARLLLRTQMKDVGIGITSDKSLLGEASANYDPVSNTILMSPETAANPQIVLHEILHAASVHQIHNKTPEGVALNKLFEAARRKAFQFAEDVDGGDRLNMYGFRNVYEFLSESMSNPDFQKVLQETKLSRKEYRELTGRPPRGKIGTWWDGLLDVLSKAFGMSKDMLDITLQTGSDLVGKSNPEMRNFYTQAFQHTPAPPAMNMVDPYAGAKRGPGTTVKNLAGDTLYDTRTAEQVVKDTDWSTLQDISKLGTNTLQGYNIASLARKNPLVRWYNSLVLRADREVRIQAEQAKYGDEWVGGKRWESHKKTNKGALTFLENNVNTESGKRVHEALTKFDRDGVEPTEALLQDLNPAERQTVLNIRKQFNDFAKKWNDLAEKAGFTKINVRPGFIPHMRLGDTMVYVKNAKGETVRAYGARNMREAKQIEADMKASFPEYQVFSKPRVSRYDMNDVTAFREALSLLEKGGKEYKILDSAYKQILSHRGFAKTTLFRRGAEGYLGENSPKDLAKAFEMYFDRGYRFLGNQQKSMGLSNLMDAAKAAEKEIPPNTLEYLQNYRDNSVGAIHGLEQLDQLVEYVGRTGGKYIPGVSADSGRQLLSGVNGMASVYWLTTPRFMLAQMMQPLMNIPKMTQLKGQMGLDKSVTAAFFKGYFDTMKFSKDPYVSEAMTYAKKQGFIDSKIIDLMNMKLAANKVQGWFSGVGKVAKGSLGKLEQEAVRTPTFMMYDNLLKDTIKDKQTRWNMAGELTDAYMVNYTRSERPLMYAKGGLVGEAAAPLKQFTHAYYGQAFEYLQGLKRDKDFKTMTAFLGVQLMNSGLKGLLLAAEYNILAMALNNMAGTNLPTMEEMLITHDFGDWATFGGVSAITGVDLSSALSAPSLEGLLSFPGVGFGQNLVEGVGGLASAAMKGTATDEHAMRALQAVTPNIAHGSIEQAFTKEGMGPPNVNNGMKPDLPPRDAWDKFARVGLGGRSTNEAREMIRMREFKRDESSYKKKMGEITDKMVYEIERGGNLDSVVNKYIEKGGTGEGLDQILVKKMIDRNMAFAERMVARQPKTDRLQRLERFRMLIEQQSPAELAETLQEFKRQENGGN